MLEMALQMIIHKMRLYVPPYLLWSCSVQLPLVLTVVQTGADAHTLPTQLEQEVVDFTPSALGFVPHDLVINV